LIKIVTEILSARCHILKPKYSEMNFGWAPHQTHWGSLQSSQAPYMDLRSLLLSQERGRGRMAAEGPHFYDEVYAYEHTLII